MASTSSNHHRDSFVTPYGTVLGEYQGVPGYSNGNDHYYSREQNYHNGLYTGISYQCVEYVRRWLQSSKGLNFHNIPFASHAWKLRYVERISDSRATAIKPVANGSATAPVVDSLLIWKSTEQAYVGHIAVITEVSVEGQFIRIAEQNISNDYWPGNYSRELKLDTQNSQFLIQDEHEILGWMVINFDVDGQDQSELGLDNIVRRVTQPVKVPLGEWLNLNSSAQKLWSDIWGTEPTRKGEEMISFYAFESHFADKINFAAMELNHMCLRATDHVIQSDELLRTFGLPEWVWPKIRNSWKGMWVSGWKTFSGRFDLSFNGRTVKMFEYNSDSAGTYLECGVIQVNWANSVGCDVGRSAAQELEEKLVEQAKELFSGKFVHLMIDNDEEEIYSAMYIQEVFTKAGVESKLVVGLDVSTNADGRFVDNEGREIKTVWKMWNWETVITSYSAERVENKLKLSDVLLDDNIDVYEPIWKLVTSNKALLPVLWELFPGHPYLLRTEWSLSEEMSQRGYAKKPIVGRCGQNVQIFKSGGAKVEEMEGKYSSRDHIYQEIFEIQEFDGFHPVIGAWIVGRRPAGFGIREDTKLITDHESPYGCCRIERFKNRANFVGRQGNIEVGTTYVEKPRENQVFHQMIQKTEPKPPATAFAVPNDLTRPRFLPVEGEVQSIPVRKQTHSAKPLRNLDTNPKDFSKPSNVYSEDFRPYNLKDYQVIKSEKYYQLGGLGPSQVGSDEWTQKKELTEKRMNYGRRVNIANASLNQSKKVPEDIEKELSKAEKAKIFAKNIPKPMKKVKTQEPPPAMNSVLEELEKQHNSYKQSVQAIISEYKDCIK